MKEHKDNSVDSKKEKNNTKPKTSSNKEDVSKYTKKIQELELKNQELEDKYLRSEAEIQNAQNRYSKERAQLIKYESQSIAKDILPALDNLERALMVESDSDVTVQLKKGSSNDIRCTD